MASSDPSNRVREVRCPACGGTAVYAPSNPARPFCSDRCKRADLGAWANEEYRVAGAPSDELPKDPDD